MFGNNPMRIHFLLLVVVPLRMLGFPCQAADGQSASSEYPLALPKPYVVVEAWHDREYCSDLYAYDFDGKMLRRLTDRPLPSCNLMAVSENGDQVTFIANASAFYNLSTRHDLIAPLHAGNVEAVAMVTGGSGVAYTACGFEWGNGQFLYVQPLVGGAPLKRIEIELLATPQELAFSPEGKKILLTMWNGDRARIDYCDLESRKFEAWMSDPNVSYYEPTFAPDGGSVAAICESLDTGEWTIVSKGWPAGDVKTLRAGPRGVAMSTPIFTADGKHLLFWQGGVLARMTVEGGEAEGLSGEVDNTPQAVVPLGLLDRPRPARSASMPLVVGRWIAFIDYVKPGGRLVVIDVRTKEKKIVPLPKGKLVRAVVVE
jgi:hypothetical protein